MTTVKFGKNVAPLIEVKLEKVEGAVVQIKKWVPEYVLRDINDRAKSDADKGAMVLAAAIASWNLVDENDEPIEINEETINRLPSQDLMLLFNMVNGETVSSTSISAEAEKNS